MPQYFILALLGLVWGSFLNVVIHRLPLAGAADAPGLWFFAWPPSFCPKCRAPIRALHNIPLLSYLLLRGKCAVCGAKISPRYPMVEALGALAAVACVWRFGESWSAALALLFVSALIVAAAIDAERLMVVPDEIVLPLAWLGLLANLDGRFAPLSAAVIGAVGGYVALAGAVFLFSLIIRREAMGRGDLKLFAAVGAWLGWMDLPFVLFGGAMLGVLASGAAFLLPANSLLRRRVARYGYFSFAPFLAAAAVVMLFFGDAVAARYFAFAGM